MLTQRQIDLWWAYYLRNPWGEEREDIRHSIRCVVSYKAAGMKKSLSNKMFIPKFGKKQTPKMTLEQLERELAEFEKLRQKNREKNGR